MRRLRIFSWCLTLTVAVFVNIVPYLLNENKIILEKSCKMHDTTPAEDMAKIEKLKFPGIQQYIDDLFPPLLKDPDSPELPVFVTAFSSNHFAEGMYLLKHLKEVVRPNYEDLKVIVYDIGLHREQVSSVIESCFCEMRKFPFDRYPKHVSVLHNYTWKPIIIQTVAKEHPLVFWMDTSVRFKTGHLDNLFAAVKINGLMVLDEGPQKTTATSIAARTHNATFKFLHEDPCEYAYVGEKYGTILFFFTNQLITKYILLPWVSCALSLGCMEPVNNSYRLLRCPMDKRWMWILGHHRCHRFDQSVIGILSYRLFHQEMAKHAIESKYFKICRSVGNCFKV